MVGECRDVCGREEWMGAVSTLKHTGVAVAPGAFEAELAVPVAVVGEGEAGFAEGSLVESQL